MRQNASQKICFVCVFVIDDNFNLRSSSSIMISLNQMSEKYDWLWSWSWIMKSSSSERVMIFLNSEKLFSRMREVRMFDLINALKNKQISIQEMSRSMYVIVFSIVARLRRNIKYIWIKETTFLFSIQRKTIDKQRKTRLEAWNMRAREDWMSNDVKVSRIEIEKQQIDESFTLNVLSFSLCEAVFDWLSWFALTFSNARRKIDFEKLDSVKKSYSKRSTMHAMITNTSCSLNLTVTLSI